MMNNVRVNEEFCGRVPFTQTIAQYQPVPLNPGINPPTRLDADGLALQVEHFIETIWPTPGLHAIDALVQWLPFKEISDVWHHPCQSSVYEPAREFATVASGLLVVPVEPKSGRFILAFRREVVQTVAWGGNPTDAVCFEADGNKTIPGARSASGGKLLKVQQCRGAAKRLKSPGG